MNPDQKSYSVITHAIQQLRSSGNGQLVLTAMAQLIPHLNNLVDSSDTAAATTLLLNTVTGPARGFTCSVILSAANQPQRSE